VIDRISPFAVYAVALARTSSPTTPRAGATPDNARIWRSASAPPEPEGERQRRAGPLRPAGLSRLSPSRKAALGQSYPLFAQSESRRAVRCSSKTEAAVFIR
jgi:hypothetical protein